MDKDNKPSFSRNESINQLNLDREIHPTLKFIKNMINTKKLSDVTFLVGENKIMMYGHKLILSAASPAFEKMFYGEFEQEPNAIEVTDLTEIGFLNMLKFIYGYEMNYDLSELYETYQALNKYLVYDHEEKTLQYIEKRLNESSCFSIYTQLIKMQKKTDCLDFVKSFIQINCSATFFTESFLKIDEETLIKLLNLDCLNLDEFSILKACSNWVDYKVRECGDKDEILKLKREKFDKIKNYIKFSELTLLESFWAREFDVLSDEEIGNMFRLAAIRNSKSNEKKEKSDNELKVTNDEASIIMCNTERRSMRPFIIEDKRVPIYTLFKTSFSSKLLTVNRKILISSISTTIRSNIELELSFSENKNDLHIKYEKKEVDKKWCFYFTPYLKLEPEQRYKIEFKLGSYLPFNHFSEKEHFKYRSENYNVDVSKDKVDNFQFIQKIEFFNCSLSSLS